MNITTVNLTPFQVAIVRSLIGQYRDGIQAKKLDIATELHQFVDVEYLNEFIDECDCLLVQLPEADKVTSTFS